MSNIKTYLISIITLAVLCPFLSAAPKKAFLGVNNGLINNSVNVCLCDSKGYIWIGSWGGLDRYDGNEVINFNKLENGSRLGSGLVDSIIEMQEGVFWVGTSSGIDKLDLNVGKWTNYGYGKWFKSFTKGPVFDLSSDKRLFCISIFGGLSYYDEKSDSFKNIDFPEFPEEEIIALKCDGNRKLILLMKDGTIKRLSYHLEESMVVADGISDFIPGDNYYSMFSSGSYALFVNEEKLILHNTKGGENISCPTKQLPIDRIGYFCQHGNDTYITYEGKLLKIDFEKGDIAEVSDFSKQITRSIYFDDKGLVWMGTGNNGVTYVYNDNVFDRCVIDGEGDSPSTQTCSMVEDSFSNIYSCAIGESTLFRNGKACKLPNDINPEGSELIKIIPSSIEHDYFLVYQSGIAVARMGKDEIEEVKRIFKSENAIHSVSIDTTNEIIYFSCYGKNMDYFKYSSDNGRYRVDESSKRTYMNPSFALGLEIIDTDGTLLIPTVDSGNHLFNGKTGEAREIETQNEKGETDAFLYFRLRDSKDRIWAYTDSGLSIIRKNGERFVIERTLDINIPVKSIIEGKDEIYWLSTDRNIIAYNYREDRMTSFNDESNPFENLFTNCGLASSGGKIILGTNDGYLSFNQDELFTIDYTPNIAVTRLILGVDNQIEVFNPNTTVLLGSNERSIDIHYSAIDFIGNSNINYFYKLDKGNWIPNENKRNVLFSNLRPGKHNFHLKSTNSYGIMCDNEVTLPFRIKYPLYLRWWAILTYILLAFFIQYLIKEQSSIKKEIEEEKKFQKRKEAEVSAKLDFFANLAHDFNSPLTVISSCSEQLSTAPGLNLKEKRFVTLIEENSERMNKLIQELLEFRKVDSGHFVPNVSNYDLVPQLESIIEGYRLSYQQKNIHYDISLPKSMYIESDRDAIERILMNLVSNAHKYVSNDGVISIRLEKEGNKEIKLSIKNTGKGLDNKDIEKFFDRYVLLDSFEKQVGDGNVSRHGLGLALVKSLVDALGGTISVNSKREEFTELIVMLPYNEAQAPMDNVMATGIASLSSISEKSTTIMVVDDESDVREVIASALQDRYMVIQAGNGAEALKHLEFTAPKLIITDINMPQMDGVELIKRLRQNPSTCHVPVIVLSVNYDIDSQIESIRTGAEAFLSKPFKAKQLNAMVDRLLESREDAKKYYSSSAQRYEQLFNKNISVEEKRFISECAQRIEGNLVSDKLSTVFLADLMCVSETTLYRRVKNALDISPVELIRLVRINHAASLLKSTNLTILEVMDRSGFKSRTYFYRVFSEQFKMTPKEFKGRI